MVLQLAMQILLKTRPKDKREMADDLREVFDNFEKENTKDNALSKLESFIGKWKPVSPFQSLKCLS